MLQIGVIGTGSMGKNHARVCSELAEVELVGVADRDKTTAIRVADRCDTKAYVDFTEMLSDVDAVIVATPTITHHDIAMEALVAGKHVLVEKPICDSVHKAQQLVNKAEKENLVLAVGHIERHNPVVRFVKDAMVEGRYGDLITLATKRVSNFPGRIRDVGVILDFGVHDIDVMRYLAGEVTSVYARAGTFNRSINHEDHASIVLTFKDGVSGVVEVNWLTPMKIRRLSLTCSEHFVEADYIDQSVTVSSSSYEDVDEMDLYRVPIQYNINRVALESREPLKNEIEDFVTAIVDNRKPLATGHDGIMALKVAEAALVSYRQDEAVDI
ncbi:MAG: Gfo/Idh/MocA family oxidoreductase [Thermoplasmatota archaeon]